MCDDRDSTQFPDSKPRQDKMRGDRDTHDNTGGDSVQEENVHNKGNIKEYDKGFGDPIVVDVGNSVEFEHDFIDGIESNVYRMVNQKSDTVNKEEKGD